MSGTKQRICTLLGMNMKIRGQCENLAGYIWPKMDMNTAFLSAFAWGILLFSGCIQRSSVEQRVVELPAGLTPYPV